MKHRGGELLGTKVFDVGKFGEIDASRSTFTHFDEASSNIANFQLFAGSHFHPDHFDSATTRSPLECFKTVKGAWSIK